MELKYLNTFRTIIDEGSFSKAAKKLNYTQSTITFQIGQLELELGTVLFEKIGRNMVLTKAGEHLIPYVDEVLASVNKMRCFEQELKDCQGELHIGVGETLLCYRLPEILKEFHKRAPRAKLFIQSMNCYEIRDALLAGTLDLGVFYEDVGVFGSGLECTVIGTYEVVLTASPELEAKYRDFVTPDQEIAVPFIINEKNCIFRQMFEQYLGGKSIRLDHTIELWSIPTIKNLVKSNVGISFLPKFAVQEELENGELVELITDMKKTHITAICACHKNKWKSPLMNLFMELCSKAASCEAPPRAS